jgi:penicillin-binding protein 2
MGDHLKSFGLGDFMGYDLPTGKEEIYLIQNVQTHVPERRMESTTIISNSIGQGEVLMTPIQLASMMAAVANEGYYYASYHQKIKREQQLTLNLR